MAKKGNRIQVILECTHKTSGVAGTQDTSQLRTKKNTPDRLEIKKFNPLKRVTVHKEIK
jgi:large subunit ribosomal protein L33